MAEIFIGNSRCKISGLTKDQAILIKDKLSYEVDSPEVEVRYRTVNGRKEKFVIRKKYRKSLFQLRSGTFPTGVLSRVSALLTKKKIKHVIHDDRTVPELQSWSQSFDLKELGFVPWQWQIDAPKACLDAGRGIVCAPTGTGKSLTAVLIAMSFGVKTLIVVPSLGLRKQLTDTFNEMFGQGTAGRLVDRKAQFAVTIENIDALRPTDDLTGVDLLMIDEFHHSAADTYRNLNDTLWDTIYWKIGLTATPFRSKSSEGILMESVLDSVIYNLPYREAVDQGIICPMQVYYVDAPKLPRPRAYTNYHKMYSEMIVKNDDRNELIAKFAKTFYKKQKSSLILLKQIQHGETIRDLLINDGIDVPFAEGQSSFKDHDIQNFCKQVEPVLIGTVGVLGEGIDTKPAEYVLISGGGKAKVQLMQNLGRIFRTFPGKTEGVAILIKDSENDWLLNHFEECVKTIKKEYGLNVDPLPDDFFD